MVKFWISVQNVVDGSEKVIWIPMNPNELKETLSDIDDYVIFDSNLNCDLTRDIESLNNDFLRLADENPNIDNDVFDNISSVYGEIGSFWNKILDNDFMYEEIDFPESCDSTSAYCAYILASRYGVPFSKCIEEMDDAIEAGENYSEWDAIWEIYYSMGFDYTEDIVNKKIYIINMEDSNL